MAEKIKRTASEQGRASREKGKRFERDVANFFKEYDVKSARRTAQCMGKTGAAGDVEGVPSVHVECKFVEKPAMITLALGDWIGMYLAWRDSQRKTKEGGD